MNTNGIRVIHYKDVPQGGFAGILEKRMVISPNFFGGVGTRQDISHGFGDFVYLATRHFKPHDGADLHPHRNVDIVTVVLNGRLAHAGSVADGTVVHGLGVQVQRAGKGMVHSEVNPGDQNTEFVQMWFLPPQQDLAPNYQNIAIRKGELKTVLGGNDGIRFENTMTCKVGVISGGTSFEYGAQFIALITRGEGKANGVDVRKGDLIEGRVFRLEASSDINLVLVHKT